MGLTSYLIVISIHEHINPAFHFLLHIQFFLFGRWQEGHGIGIAGQSRLEEGGYEVEELSQVVMSDIMLSGFVLEFGTIVIGSLIQTVVLDKARAKKQVRPGAVRIERKLT